MRFGDYEVLPRNRWCYQLYRVMPDGYETEGVRRRANDGKILEPIECYPTDMVRALEWVMRFAEKDGAATGDAQEMISRLRALYDQISSVARLCPAPEKQKEATR